MPLMFTHYCHHRSYGIAYWHKKFPHWPLKIRRCECREQAAGAMPTSSSSSCMQLSTATHAD